LASSSVRAIRGRPWIVATKSERGMGLSPRERETGTSEAFPGARVDLAEQRTRAGEDVKETELVEGL
jgi:hypothetical protein